MHAVGDGVEVDNVTHLHKCPIGVQTAVEALVRGPTSLLKVQRLKQACGDM